MNEREQLALSTAARRTADRAPQRRPPGHPIIRAQRHVGNRAVTRLLMRSAAGETVLASDVEARIESARGGGRALDSVVRAEMEDAFGADFSGVRVHTGHEANDLNRAVSARAFATGGDVFFRDGEYDPGSSGGRELLAHELTHVVQQSGGVSAKLVVGGADDPAEREADEVARAVLRRQDAPLPTEEEDEERVQRQPELEERKEEEEGGG